MDTEAPKTALEFLSIQVPITFPLWAWIAIIGGLIGYFMRDAGTLMWAAKHYLLR